MAFIVVRLSCYISAQVMVFVSTVRAHYRLCSTSPTVTIYVHILHTDCEHTTLFDCVLSYGTTMDGKMAIYLYLLVLIFIRMT